MFPYSKTILALLFITLLISCKHEKHDPLNVSTTEEKIEVPDHVVVISKNAPKAQRIYLSKDENGNVDSTGAFMPARTLSIDYLDKNHLLKKWEPKAQEIDSLQIDFDRSILELSIYNPYSMAATTFLVNKGDTIEIDFEGHFAKAKILNRPVKDLDLNYNYFRKERFFVDGFDPNHILLHSFLSYSDSLSLDDSRRLAEEKRNQKILEEMSVLDSLYEAGALSDDVYKYRYSIHAINNKSDLNGNAELALNSSNPEMTNELNPMFANLEELDSNVVDSMMTYGNFRGKVNMHFRSKFPTIKVDRGNSGSYFIDYRRQFDTIVNGNYPQSIKEMMLFNAYRGIVENFKVKKEYYQKLAENTANIEKLNKIKKSYNLDFGSENKLLLMNQLGVESEYSQLIQKHKGKWLYVDFWASWCRPCIETFPAAKKLQEDLKNENLEFITIALNDQEKAWKAAMLKHGIAQGENYLIKNSTTSIVLEELQIETIPHYLIYNPEGELVNGYAKRPGEGAKQQLQDDINQIQNN